jgi:hypothetical protein
MAALAWITGVILTVGFLAAGGTKLAGTQMAVDMADKLGYRDKLQAIGAAEVAGAIGVFIGILSEGNDLEWIGLLAALGLIGMMVGAVIHHRRAGDAPKDYAPAIGMAILSVLYIVAISQR